MKTRDLSISLTFCLAATSHAAIFYQDNMESGAGWGTNATSADSSASFGYDYSADGIPEAPHSQPGDAANQGVKLQANLAAPNSLEVITLFPVGQSFSGNYTLRFDAWMNYDVNERINGGSAGTTEFMGGVIGYDGVSADVSQGLQVMATNDGGSGSDYRVFADSTFLDPGDMTAGDRNGFNAYYSDFLPGVAPPATQAQTVFVPGEAGSPGFQWVTWELTVLDSSLNVFLEKPDGSRLEIATLDDGTFPTTTDGNIAISYADYFSSVTARPDLTFGVIDNVFVTDAVPEPSPAALGVLGGLLFLGRRQRSI